MCLEKSPNSAWDFFMSWQRTRLYAQSIFWRIGYLAKRENKKLSPDPSFTLSLIHTRRSAGRLNENQNETHGLRLDNGTELAQRNTKMFIAAVVSR
mmetsp:Transcript_3520/g.6635  ORF Transcript_3520/g.6635 Transcript_3520/m.6635 type:complete len:96 (+) Transcript_3520:74-361(+)